MPELAGEERIKSFIEVDQVIRGKMPSQNPDAAWNAAESATTKKPLEKSIHSSSFFSKANVPRFG